MSRPNLPHREAKPNQRSAEYDQYDCHLFTHMLWKDTIAHGVGIRCEVEVERFRVATQGQSAAILALGRDYEPLRA